MPTRLLIAAIVFMMVNAVVFGAGVTLVLAVPVLSAQAGTLIPVLVVASIILSLPVSWLLAPRLRARYWRERPAAG